MTNANEMGTKMLKIGDAVKLSDYALRDSRDHYLSVGGPERDKRKGWFDTKQAMRGTVLELLPSGPDGQAAGYAVQWADGTVSKSMAYRIASA